MTINIPLIMTPFLPIVILNGARMLFGKDGKRSEESITRMTSYRLPHYGYRSFAFASDDALLSVITQNGGRKRIFILFFCVIPPSQYPPSGSAGHLLINKEAYPIPILTVGTLS